MGRLLGSDISTKPAVIKLEQQGCFGNRIRSWYSIEELMASEFDGRVMIRYRDAASMFCISDIECGLVPKYLIGCVHSGAILDKFWFTEMGPVKEKMSRLFQGEVQRSERYVDLFYATSPNKVMRQALAEDGKSVSGIMAVQLLRTHMEPSAFEDLQVIWDHWPNAVVEFTTWGRPIGQVLGRHTNFRRQTTFWEVREY